MLYFIIPICSGILNISSIKFHNEIISIMEHFHIYQPNIQNSFLSTRDILKLCKKLSNQNREITKINQSILPYRSIIQFQEISDFNWTRQNFAQQNKVPNLVVSKIQDTDDLKNIDLPINAEVYFIDVDSLKTYEAYKINEIQVTRYLGQFEMDNGIMLFKKSKGNFLHMTNS